MNKNITAIVFARNEEKRIPLIFQNLKGFCEIIVFDGGSTDGTEELCKQNNIKFGISCYGTILYEMAYHNKIVISAGSNPRRL